MAKAGKTVPLKFSLGGYHGRDIMLKDPGTGAVAFGSGRVDCATPKLIDPTTVKVETPEVGYNAKLDEYVVNWRTEKGWEGTCRRVVFWLNDGKTFDGATFQFGTPVADPIAAFAGDAASFKMQGLIEYALILVLIAIIVLGAIALVEGSTGPIMDYLCVRAEYLRFRAETLLGPLPVICPPAHRTSRQVP